MGQFLWDEVEPSRDHVKILIWHFKAVEVGRGWMNWLKNGTGNCLYFMQLFLYYILFGENFIG